jgi:hypothetical protein
MNKKENNLLDSLFELANKISEWEELYEENIEEIKKGNIVLSKLGDAQLKYIEEKIDTLKERYYEIQSIVDKTSL